MACVLQGLVPGGGLGRAPHSTPRPVWQRHWDPQVGCILGIGTIQGSGGPSLEGSPDFLSQSK